MPHPHHLNRPTSKNWPPIPGMSRSPAPTTTHPVAPRWMGMLLFRVLLITLTLGYSGIGLLWELQHLDLQHLTAWDKVGCTGCSPTASQCPNSVHRRGQH